MKFDLSTDIGLGEFKEYYEKLVLKGAEVELKRVTTLNEWLVSYDDTVEKYSKLEWNDRAQLNSLLKTLTVVLSQMEHERGKAHEKHNGIMFNFDGAVSRAQIQADHDVPELYRLRRIMSAGYRIGDSMRSNISSLNKEQ